VTKLSIVLEGGELPDEFRIFAFGVVESTKGPITFDEDAAKSVMAEYVLHGTELMIDYDHASLAPVSIDPAHAGKAAGWFNLEVRDGELWATSVRWTPRAAEMLAQREWRYISPAFNTDKDGRVTSLLNVAITNLPATRRLEPLMAASAVALGASMLSEETMEEARRAIHDGDEAKCMELLKGIVEAASGEPADAPAEEDPVAMAVEPTAEEEKPAEVIAASARLIRLSGASSFGAAVDEAEVWRTEALGARAALKQVAEERAVLELGKRKENAIALTKLGAETPHTSGLAKGKLCKRLLDEPLDEQSDRVTALLAARGGKLPVDVKPPAAGGSGDKDFANAAGDVVALSVRELDMCAEMKIDPKDYAARKPAKKG